MILSLDDVGSLQIHDPSNFKAFSFRGSARQRVETPSVTFIGDYAWISEAALRRCAPVANNDEWQARLTSMIAYASSQGWVDPAAGRIRAHIEACGQDPGES